METFTPYTALCGGLLIGSVAAAYLYLHGRVCGISGMLSDLASLHPNLSWSGFFLLGLVSGGAALRFFHPTALEFDIPLPFPLMLLAGLLVGFGARMGGGCTSGHGVCGIGLTLKRSLIATAVFLFFGIATASLLYHFIIGDPIP